MDEGTIYHQKELGKRYDQLVDALLRSGYDVCDEYIGNVHATSDGAYIYVKYKKPIKTL